MSGEDAPVRHAARSQVLYQIVRDIPGKVYEVIQTESRQLQKALAVLTCPQEAAEYEIDVDLADVAAVACELTSGRLRQGPMAGGGSL